MSTLGDRLKARRLALGRTMSAVANDAGVSLSHLSALEAGHNIPSLPVLASLVHALGLSMSEVLRQDGGQVRTGTIDSGQAGRQTLSDPALRLEVVRLGSAPGTEGEAPFPVAGHQVFVYINRGALELEVDQARYRLEQGDALDALGVDRITWRATGRTVTESLWAVGPTG